MARAFDLALPWLCARFAECRVSAIFTPFFSAASAPTRSGGDARHAAAMALAFAAVPRLPCAHYVPRRAPRARVAPWRLRAVAEAEAPNPTDAPTLPSADSVDLDGLKRECRRLCDRAVKKVGKATTRLRESREAVEALEADPNPSMEALEACPDVDALAKDLGDEKDRLAALNRLADALAPIKSVNNPKFIDDAYPLAVELGVNDAPPRGPRVSRSRSRSRPTPDPASRTGPSSAPTASTFASVERARTTTR